MVVLGDSPDGSPKKFMSNAPDVPAAKARLKLRRWMSALLLILPDVCVEFVHVRLERLRELAEVDLGLSLFRVVVVHFGPNIHSREHRAADFALVNPARPLIVLAVQVLQLLGGEVSDDRSNQATMPCSLTFRR